jgi:hypothetical protein
MQRPVTYAMMAACLVAGCGKAATGAPAEATRIAAVLSGDAKGEAADNPQCKMFTAAEVAKYIGEPVSGPGNAAMGTGCQWMARDGSGHAMVQVVAGKDHNPPSGANGFREVPDVGKDGFVVPEMGGWAAGAVRGKTAVEVSVRGRSASPDLAVALLREALKRQGG